MAEEKKNGQQDLNQLLKIRREKLAQLVEEGKNPFEITKYDVTHHTTDIVEQYETLEGKGSFRCRTSHVQTCYGQGFILPYSGSEGHGPVLCGQRRSGRGCYKDFKKYDIGDIVGVKGFVFTTKTG